jgi:hypothetical protein
LDLIALKLNAVLCKNTSVIPKEQVELAAVTRLRHAEKSVCGGQE